MSRIYKVSSTNGQVRLVKANSKGAAINHCISSEYDAVPVNSSDLYELMQANVLVEVAEERTSKPAAPQSTVVTPELPKAVASTIQQGASPQGVAQSPFVHPSVAATSNAQSPIDWNSRENVR